MNEQPERPLLTPEQQTEFMKNCDHVGTHGPVSNNVVISQNEILVISSYVCMLCGSLFTNISPIPMPGTPSGGGILQPQDRKTKIIKPL